MVKSAPVHEAEQEAPIQTKSPWWLAENGLRVLQQRYFQQNTDSEFIEDLNGILTRVCENQAHIDGLWGIFKHYAGTLRNTRPDQLSDENIALLKTPEGQAEFNWSESAHQHYEKARYDAYMRYRLEMDEGLYLPATPILLNSGARTGMLYSCFVIPMDDTLMSKPGDPEGTCGIFDCVRAVVAVQKSGGGTGVSISRTRPRGGQIFGGETNRKAGVVIGHSTGSVNWLEEISDAVKHIEQGSARHGANMGILRCLGGDTIIHTLSGRVPIRKLVGTRPYVYACDTKTKKVRIVQANKVFVSDTNRALVRVWLDNDDFIDCTPDHRFMLKGGRYREAGKLKIGDSLMAFEKRLVKHGKARRYVRTIACTSGRAEYEHRTVARDILGRVVDYDWNVHHVDEDPTNNDPSNLEVLSRADHATEHVQNLLENQRRIAKKRKGKTLEEVYGPEKAAKWKARMSAAGKGRKKAKPGNHRVVRVAPIGVAAEVYDISLPRWHNFAANEVFVHNCDHPDIIEFIMVKDGTRLRNFNISVAMTDAFLTSLERRPDAVWMCMNPHTKKKEMCYDKLGTAKDPSHPWTVGEIWNLIITRAWELGDPGLWFIDRVNRTNPTPNLGDYEACNPCVTGDTWVMTEHGPRQVEDMLHESVKVMVSGEAFPSETGFFETGVRPVFELRTKEGYRVKMTEDHKVMRVLRKGRMVWGATEWVEAKHLQPGDKIALHDHRDRAGWPGTGLPEHGYLLGYLLGDGIIVQATAVLSVWGIDDDADSLCMALEKAADVLAKRSDAGGFGALIEERNERRMQRVSLKEIAASYGMEPGSKTPDERLEETGSQFHASFLKGLFDADGSVQGNHEKGVSVRLSQSDSATLEMCQRMLLRIGIASTIYRDRRPAQSRPLPDGRGGTKNYDCKAQHELVISGVNMRFFRDRIGFEHAGKQMKLLGALEGYHRELNIERFVATFEELADLQTEERVYDIQVPGIHAFDGNGLMLHNCGEQPLLSNESCNLGSIVLSRFIDSGPPKHGEHQIDWTKMERTVRTAIRHHEAVIDSNVYTVEVPSIRRATKATRKIGLGVMGWWDLLVRLGIPYESDEAVQLAEKVMGFINRIAQHESADLALERGTFPAYEGSAEQTAGLKTRNATRSTIAPTGTISILANITGGIEPTFGLAYIRDTPGTGGRVEEINATFQAWLDEQVETKRFTKEEAREILESAFRGESVSENPLLRPEEKRLFRTANEIAIEWHIRHQAAFQKHTDNSVSKTINAPRDATRADIERAYNMAVEEGLHGITIFRDGCLDASGQTQPMSYKKAKDDDKKVEGSGKGTAIGKSFAPLAPKPATIRPLRPQIGISMKSLVGTVHLHITVDPKWDRELEVFGCVGKAGQLKLAQMEGMGRLISQILRLGGTMELVISQLKGIGSNHSTLSSGGRHRSLEDTVGHMLAKYLEAKQRWGMKALLLGEIEDDELRAFISAPLEAKQQEMDAFWGSSNGEGEMKSVEQHHGLVCGKCSSPIFLVGGCAVCLGCGDSQC